MVRLNLSLGDVGNCEETTAFIKNKVLNFQRAGQVQSK